MNAIKLLSAGLLFTAGYLSQYFKTGVLPSEGTIYLGLLIIAMVTIGFMGIIVKDTKTFKQNIKDILNGLPL